MAGIGFILRKLARQDNLMGMAQAYTHATLASAGPWIFTIFTLGSIVSVGSRFITYNELFNFKIIIVYNFAFSLVLSGPIFMIITRYLADSIHRKNVTGAPGVMLGGMILLFITQTPIVFWFYVFYANLKPAMALAAIINFLMISNVWLLGVFITALKDYKAITQAFIVGLTIAIITSAIMANYFGPTGMLCGFSLGLSFIIAMLIARIFSEYPYKFKTPFAFMSYFKKYWEIAISGFIYNIAAWVDKWIMWFSPQSEIMENNLRLYSNYDSAMFLAYISIVPSMAIFVFSIETNFFEKYLNFYRDIQNRATFEKITLNHQKILSTIFKSGRNFIILQGTICIMSILLAPRLFSAMGINFLQIGIFKFGVLGAFFHVLTMFLIILLSYFDNRKLALFVQIFFMITNAGFTFFFLDKGFAFYGCGYFLSSLITFILCFYLTIKYVSNLPYHTFITTNKSVT